MIGIRYEATSFTSATSGTQFGGFEFYDRIGYVTNEGLIISDTIVVRTSHPITGTYRIRPWIKTSVSGNMNLNQSTTASSLTAFEVAPN